MLKEETWKETCYEQGKFPYKRRALSAAERAKIWRVKQKAQKLEDR